MIKELLKRPIGVTMSVIAIVVLSIVAMGYLPVSLMPDIDIPQITIQVSAPGLSVREVDNTLLKPLKNQLSQVAGLKNITAEAGRMRGRFIWISNRTVISISFLSK